LLCSFDWINCLIKQVSTSQMSFFEVILYGEVGQILFTYYNKHDCFGV
jgi:hypothetical protein